MSAIYCRNGEVITCDDGHHDILDEKGEKMDPDDAVLARLVAAAVFDALRSHRQGRDSHRPRTEADLTARQQGQIYDGSRTDHRKDFNTLGGNGARDSALSDDYRTRLLRSEFGVLASGPTYKHDGLNLEALFGVSSQ